MFAPTALETPLVHEWQYYDENSVWNAVMRVDVQYVEEGRGISRIR